MKNQTLSIITFMLLVTAMFAQVPQGVNYQTVVRNNSGAVIPNQNIAFRFSVVSGSPTGTIVYSELHSTNTNQLGLVNLVIGQGTPITGTFSNINWGNAAHYLSVDLDPAGGTAFQPMGTQQLMSVPYALSAGNSSTSMAQLTDVTITGVSDGQVLKWNATQSKWLPANDIGGGTGDNWGTQTVQADNTLSGDGTNANPLKLAQQGATSGQVLKWNGTNWLPANDVGGGTGDNWGTQVVQTNNTLTGNGTSGSPLAVNGVLTDNQTLSINGTTLSISNGNSVTLPSGGGSGWALTGNSGTNATSNFIGTTDAQPLNIRTNNTIKTRITTKGQIEVLNTGNSVFVGESAGANDDLTNRRNVFVGFESGLSNTTGSQNTAVGYQSLSNNSNTTNTGSQNTAIGARSLGYSNTTGSSNVAIGYLSLANNTIGSSNVAIGNNTLLALGNSNGHSGNWNVAVGNNALSLNTTGEYNVAIGHQAMGDNTNSFGNTSGGNNVAVGYRALSSNSTGNYNTAVGNYADVDVANRTNTIVLAANGNIYPSGNNRVRIGNSSMTSIGGQVAWTNLSDERIKQNVSNDVKGLEFILKLKPVTYNYNVSKSEQLQGKKETADWTGKYDIEKIRFSGFMAQQVEAAAKEAGYSFSGIDKPEDTNGLWGLRYSEFTVPLVKAVQEQQAIIEKLMQEIEYLKSKID